MSTTFTTNEVVKKMGENLFRTYGKVLGGSFLEFLEYVCVP